MGIIDKVKDTFIKPKEEELAAREERRMERAAEKEEEKNQRELERQAERKTYSAERIKRAEEKGKERGQRPTTKEYLKEKINIKGAVENKLRQSELKTKAYQSKQVRSVGSRPKTIPQPAHRGFSFPTHSPMNFGGEQQREIPTRPPDLSHLGFGGFSPFQTTRGKKRKPPKFGW